MLGPIGIWSMATIRGKIREQKGIEVCTESCLTTDNQELHFLQNDPFQLFIHLELYRPPGEKKIRQLNLNPILSISRTTAITETFTLQKYTCTY